MNPREIFAYTRAVLTGHFVYKSGRHGTMYVNKDRVYVFPAQFNILCRAIADSLDGVDVEVVAGPAIGAAILAQGVALAITDFEDDGVQCLAVYAEKEVRFDPTSDIGGIKETGNFVFRRGYDQIVKGKKVLVVEDVLTTGGSCRKTIEAVREAGGTVVAVRALWNRGGVTAEMLGVEDFKSLVEEQFVDYPRDCCPLCADGVEINVDVGHGAAYVREHGQPQKKS